MKIVQFVKQLNNTELGKGGTHDTYVLIPNEADITDIFEAVNEPIEFYDVSENSNIVVKNTVGREKRIVGLGQYYRLKNLSAGDEIIFERREQESEVNFRIRVQTHQDIIAFKASKLGFEILTEDRLHFVEVWNQISTDRLTIEFIGSRKKRNDSPEATDYYKILINDCNLIDYYSNNEMGMLYLSGEKIFNNNFYGWKKYIFESEEK